MKTNPRLAGSSFIDLLLLSIHLAWEVHLILGNNLGLFWWAKVETSSPDTTYWFGPFVFRRSLRSALDSFLSDLSNEQPGFVSYSFVRKRCIEPYTELSN